MGGSQGHGKETGALNAANGWWRRHPRRACRRYQTADVQPSCHGCRGWMAGARLRVGTTNAAWRQWRTCPTRPPRLGKAAGHLPTHLLFAHVQHPCARLRTTCTPCTCLRAAPRQRWAGRCPARRKLAAGPGAHLARRRRQPPSRCTRCLPRAPPRRSSQTGCGEEGMGRGRKGDERGRGEGAGRAKSERQATASLSANAPGHSGRSARVQRSQD